MENWYYVVVGPVEAWLLAKPIGEFLSLPMLPAVPASGFAKA
jgi:hypothetical protein